MRLRSVALLLFWVLTAVMAYGAFHLGVEVDQTKYLPDRFESVKWQHVVERKLNTSTKTLTDRRRGGRRHPKAGPRLHAPNRERAAFQALR